MPNDVSSRVAPELETIKQRVRLGIVNELRLDAPRDTGELARSIRLQGGSVSMAAHGVYQNGVGFAHEDWIDRAATRAVDRE